MICLLCSVPSEAELLLSTATISQTVVAGGKPVHEGTTAGREIAVCIGGMGKVNAAHAATLLLARYAPEALIVFGIGGAYAGSGARVGDVALASEEIAGDEGVLTPEGFKDTAYIGIPLVQNGPSVLHNVFPAPEAFFSMAARTLLDFEHANRLTVHTGRFITLSTCTGTSLRARELEARYHGLCENMEGAAAAQVAALHGAPWLEIRGISNLVEDRDLKQWDIRTAAEAAQKAVIHVLKGWTP